MSRRIRLRKEKWAKIQPQLQLADFLLVHGEGVFVPQAIQKASKSYWNHVALIFFVPNKKYLFNNVLIIEAMNKGIEIHRIQEYTHHFNKYDIGVKRIPDLSKQERQNILYYMLQYVDTPYDHTRLIAFLISKLMSAKFLYRHQDKLIHEDQFVCSSFAQKAIYKAVAPEKKSRVILKPGSKSVSDIETITPGDIADSPNCDWIYNKH